MMVKVHILVTLKAYLSQLYPQNCFYVCQEMMPTVEVELTLIVQIVCVN